MGECGAAGRDLGEDHCGGAGPQPVESRVGVPGRRDGLDEAGEPGDRFGPGPGQQVRGPAAEAAAGAAAFLEQLVLDAAQRAQMGEWQPGAVRAHDRAWAGRRDQPPLLTARRAGAAAAQRAGVAGVADRALRPVRRWRPVPAAARADARSPGRARLADRMAAVSEVARTPDAAGRADGLRHPVTVHAHVCMPAAAPDRDRGGLAARPATPVAALVTAAPLADRLAAAGYLQ